MNLSTPLITQPRNLVVAGGLLSVAIIGYIDYVTGWGLSLFVFYALPILWVVWFGDRRSAVLLAVICGLVWFLANLPDHAYPTTQAYVWASFSRMIYFIFVAIGATAMKHYREENRARIEALTRNRELEQEILRTSERERMRIGQDLHDGLCQNLAAIDCAAECLRADLEARELPEAASAGVIQRLLREAVVEARNLARGIFPVQLTDEGLPMALEDLATTTNQLRQVVVTVEIGGAARVGSAEVALHLYRIAQQALSNAVRHSGAGHVTLRLAEEARCLTLTIADDGRGFTPADVNSDGMGLKTMRYRAETIGGELTVESGPDQGTVVRCTISLSDDAGD